MTDRYLTWYIEQPDDTKSNQGAVYILDKGYYPKVLRMYANKVPEGGVMEIDILDDDVSIFPTVNTNVVEPSLATPAYTTTPERPTIVAGEHSEDCWEIFRDDTDFEMEIQSEIKLQFVSTSATKGVTVVLELSRSREILQEDEDR